MGVYSNFIDEISQVIVEIKNAFDQRQTGISGDGTLEELERFLQNLERLKNEVESGDLPPKSSRTSSMGWFITDTWSLSSPLGEKIIKIENKYKKLE